VTKPKVLIIVENNGFLSDDRVSKEAFALDRNGYEVSVLCPRDRASDPKYERIDGIHVYRHPIWTPGDGRLGYVCEYASALLWEFLFAWWIFLRRGFDVIQGCNPPDNIVLVAAPFKLFGVKYIFDHHDANPELYLSKYDKRGTLYNLLTYLEKLTFRLSDCVMCTNASYRDLAIARGGLDPACTFIVRNGPDPETFRPRPPKPALKHGKPYLVAYVGTMGFQDGLDILVRVAGAVRDLGRRDVQFTCIGSGPELARLRKLVNDMNLGEMVTFTGRIPQEDLLDILSTADVCVNPDRPCEMNNISTMIKIMEYMSLGKPIVQFDMKEGRFSARESSLYANGAKGVSDFAAKILWLLDHPREREHMGAFGRRRVERELAWDFSVEHLLAAYEHALNGRADNQIRAASMLEEAVRRTNGRNE
jgi:glycosyltransferase involved in cell wall biosynthesis